MESNHRKGNYKNYRIEYCKDTDTGGVNMTKGPIFAASSTCIKYLERAGYIVCGFSELYRPKDGMHAYVLGNENR